MLQRLQKIIAQAGIASRRKAEEMIKQGRVIVNDRTAHIGQSADIEKDKIMVNGQEVRKEEFIYVILNKPKNVVTSNSDPGGRRTVRDIIDVNERIYPVGRLDRNASGLVLMTNDGKLANRLMHPRYETQKTYIATLSSDVTPGIIDRLRKGVVVEERKVKVDKAVKIGKRTIMLSIHEGRKHIVKKLLVKVGTHVDALHRTEIGPLKLGKLKPGQWRILEKNEVAELKRTLNL